MERHVDVAVIGGGPVGCVAAAAHAARGAKVALIEPNMGAGTRFAGELLQPAALKVLDDVGFTLDGVSEHGPTHGFAVFDGAGAEARVLTYRGRRGQALHFSPFVQRLRDQVGDLLPVRVLRGCRAKGIEGQVVHVERPSGGHTQLTAGRIIGADGRFSMVRRSLGLPHDRATLSHMAGVLLHGASLPHEGYGHVILSDVGPALAYRVSADTVRVCLDLPTPWRRSANREQLLWSAYGAVMPEGLRGPLQGALSAGRVQWATNELRPRTHYGRPGCALVGDAVGHFHPMTAAGMALGFADAARLARHDHQPQWAAERERESESPALLATALYEIFALRAAPTAALREAIFSLWAEDPTLRARTMDFLSCEDTRFSHLLRVGLRLVARSSRIIARQARTPQELRSAMGSVRSIGGLVHWLVNESVPAPMRIRSIQRAATPFAMLREEQRIQLSQVAKAAR